MSAVVAATAAAAGGTLVSVFCVRFIVFLRRSASDRRARACARAYSADYSQDYSRRRRAEERASAKICGAFFVRALQNAECGHPQDARSRRSDAEQTRNVSQKNGECEPTSADRKRRFGHLELERLCATLRERFARLRAASMCKFQTTFGAIICILAICLVEATREHGQFDCQANEVFRLCGACEGTCAAPFIVSLKL